jgi:DNA-binding NarL/FixJ family response regulator
VYCTTDLIFATRIRSTAESLGVPARPARDTAALDNRLRRVDDGKANDPVTGVMVDLEMGEAGLGLIEQVKAFDGGIPVVAFGSHVATELLQAARRRGADFVMPRSQFTMLLPDLLRQHGGPAGADPSAGNART